MSVLFTPGQVVELRVPRRRGNGWGGGWFDDHKLLAAEAGKASQQGSKAVYVTLNPVKPELLARCANRAQEYTATATSDGDILKRRWLPIDVDPKRPADISSTDEEHEHALETAVSIRQWLEEHGWPQPVYADSGNGAHLLYRIELPNSPEAAMTVKKCLESLSARFSTAEIDVDVKVYNAARIWKCYGTMARKGDDMPDRPHRQAKLIEVPDAIQAVPVELLMALADTVPTPPPPTRQGRDNSPFNITDWIGKSGLQVRTDAPWNGQGHKWLLSVCPFNSDHTDKSAVVLRHPSGAVSFSCMHNSCAGNDWHKLRDLVEPGWQRQPSDNPLPTKHPQTSAPRITPEAIKTAHDLAIEYNKYIQSLRSGRIFLGFEQIDKRTRGCGPGEVMTVIAKSRAGKSAFLQNVLWRLGRLGQTASLFCSMEQPNAQVFERYAQLGSEMPGAAIEHEWMRNGTAHIALESQVVHDLGRRALTCDVPGLTLEEVEQAIGFAREKAELPLGLVAIDYMSLIDGAALDRTLYGQASRVARELKNVAKRQSLAVILLCQVARQVGDDGSKPLTINSARESGAIEEAADFLLGLYRENISNRTQDNNITIQILKNRKGPDGEDFRYPFDRTTLKIDTHEIADPDRYVEPPAHWMEGSTRSEPWNP